MSETASKLSTTALGVQGTSAGAGATVLLGPAGRGTFLPWLVLAAVLLLTAGYAGNHLLRGWVPHDEGTLGQSAERVLQGQLPHRDFDALYTGGLDFLHAAAFRIFGIGCAAMRYVVFPAFLLAVSALFYVANRLTGPIVAGGATLLAVAWSLPNYSASVPSWYNLFFALFGTAALFRYIDTRHRRWIFLAGVCAGCSFLVKLTGVFFVAAVLLFLVFMQDTEAREERPAGHVYRNVVAAGLVLFAATVVLMVSRTAFPWEMKLVYFILPPLVLSAVCLRRAWTVADGSAVWRLGMRGALFLAGWAAPVCVFLVPYVRSGAVSALARGVFLAPAARLQHAAISPPRATAGLVLLLFLLAAMRLRRYSGVFAAVFAVALAVALWQAGGHAPIYRFIWRSASTIIPFTAFVGAYRLEHMRRNQPQAASAQLRLMLLLSVLVMCSFVQFPFAAPVYFCFVAPLVVLAWVAILSSGLAVPRPLVTVLVSFYLLFAVLRATPSFIYSIGLHYAPDAQTQLLQMPRAAGLRVAPREASVYDAVIRAVHEHATAGYTFATPNSPEIYFLSGLKNPTPILFEGYGRMPDATNILQVLDERQVRVVVLAQDYLVIIPGAVPPADISPELRAALARRFPNSKGVGNFVVRWRE